MSELERSFNLKSYVAETDSEPETVASFVVAPGSPMAQHLAEKCSWPETVLLLVPNSLPRVFLLEDWDMQKANYIETTCVPVTAAVQV